MKKNLVICFYCFCFQLFGQQDVSISVEDFNNDGVMDTIRSYYEGGSAFGGRNATIVNGKTKESFQIDTYGSFSSIKECFLIPSGLNKLSNASFLEAIKEKLFPPEASFWDPSLNWMLSGTYAHKKIPDHIYFNLIVDPKNTWQKSKVKLPKSYHIPVQGDTLVKLLKKKEDDLDLDTLSETSRGVLVYRAHNHYRNTSGDSLALVQVNNRYRIYSTSHGVIAEKGNSYKWIFISDIDITSAPDKLRWESIKEVALIDNYIILKQSVPPMPGYLVYMINIQTGVCGRLKFDFSDSDNFGIDEGFSMFSIQKNFITLHIDGEQERIAMKDFFKELDQFHVE